MQNNNGGGIGTPAIEPTTAQMTQEGILSRLKQADGHVLGTDYLANDMKITAKMVGANMRILQGRGQVIPAGNGSWALNNGRDVKHNAYGAKGSPGRGHRKHAGGRPPKNKLAKSPGPEVSLAVLGADGRARDIPLDVFTIIQFDAEGCTRREFKGILVKPHVIVVVGDAKL